jgi:hypothetical protein
LESLFKLMLCLCKIEMKGDLLLHVVHIAGTRMIEEGADSGSQGDLSQGAMAGHLIIDFVWLHLSALERFPSLEQWIQSWWDETQGVLEMSSPEGWLNEGQKDGHLFWALPHAAANVVGEQLGEARHKRPFCTYITVVPGLMAGRWWKSLGKEADLIVKIPAGTPFWKGAIQEPLILCVSLPLCRYPPWSYKRTGLLEGLRQELRQVWTDFPEQGGCLLRSFLLQETDSQMLLQVIRFNSRLGEMEIIL